MEATASGLKHKWAGNQLPFETLAGHALDKVCDSAKQAKQLHVCSKTCTTLAMMRKAEQLICKEAAC